MPPVLGGGLMSSLSRMPPYTPGGTVMLVGPSGVLMSTTIPGPQRGGSVVS
jgi:hypothetical protein